MLIPALPYDLTVCQVLSPAEILATNTYPEGGTELFPTEVGG